MQKYYKYTLDVEYFLPLPEYGIRTTTEFIAQGQLWGWLSPRGITICKGYSWDGCSPKTKQNFFGKQIILGTWDGESMVHVLPTHIDVAQQLKYASLVHDIFCQFETELPKEFERIEADVLFYHMCKETGFQAAYIYYMAVRKYAVISRFIKQLGR